MILMKDDSFLRYLGAIILNSVSIDKIDSILSTYDDFINDVNKDEDLFCKS